jgi:hypothetical protein
MLGTLSSRLVDFETMWQQSGSSVVKSNQIMRSSKMLSNGLLCDGCLPVLELSARVIQRDQ